MDAGPKHLLMLLMVLFLPRLNLCCCCCAGNLPDCSVSADAEEVFPGFEGMAEAMHASRISALSAEQQESSEPPPPLSFSCGSGGGARAGAERGRREGAAPRLLGMALLIS
jgi:hypothetical protein